MTQVRRIVVSSAWAVSVLVVLSACGGGGGSGDPPPTPPPPPPPATVSLTGPADSSIEEAANAKVPISVQLAAAASESITVELNFSGTATRGRDYEVDTDSVTVAAGATSAAVEIDVYRDFDDEGDETIEVSLGTITGNARAGDASSIALDVLDGEPATVDKSPLDENGEYSALELLPLAYTVTGEAVELTVSALNDLPDGESAPLVAEWSTDASFRSDVHRIGSVDIEPIGEPVDLFLGNVHTFRVPVSELAPNGVYYIRAYLGEAPPAEEIVFGGPGAFVEGFRTGGGGGVIVRCEAPERTAEAGADPLFAEQWHLGNTGQTGYSERGGVAGADLRMSGAIAADRNGEGVKLAVVDTGLETCHPDLAANAAGGGSYHFGFSRTAGASAFDPFNFGVLGDHGTSVAGVAAAVANNGLGGRGVAPEVTLVGFNPDQAVGGDERDPDSAFETALLQSLGASESEPDSASVDIFNMSYGVEAPSENSTEEFVRLVKMATSELREGRGALYVKAAGNEFEFCSRPHPLNRDIGCIAANADPDHNLPWLIVVGGFNADDVKSSYSSAGASLWVVGPSGEDGIEAPAIITTDQAGEHGGYSRWVETQLAGTHNGDYFSAFGGTSSAAPAVAGAIAVLLGVRPELTWRDVKHILAATARTIDSDIGEVRAAVGGTPYVAQHAWQNNAAGYDFHNWYGFGAVDIDAALEMAASYVPDSLGTFVESAWFGSETAERVPIADEDGAGVSVTVEVSGLPEFADIEAVVLEVSADHPYAFDLGITVRSPSGTKSVVNPPLNTLLEDVRGPTNWHLLSNAFYGENPNGAWTVYVADLADGDIGDLTGVRLRFYYGEHGPSSN